jgi:hypothetical protein
MSTNPGISEVLDKNGVVADIEAKRFDGTRTFTLQGDVSGTQTWSGDSSTAMTINASIGSKKVTTDKINDKAVGTGQIADEAVGLTQIAANAMNGTVQDNDSNLATHAAVKTYVDSQISGQGTYLGKHTVAEVNAMQTANLHNGDRVQMSDSGTINIGPGGAGFDVVAGEDLILYKSGSTVQWDTMDGNFKTKQTAVPDPTASGTGLTFIATASQNANGDMSVTKTTVQDGTTSQKGVVQLAGSIGATVESENNNAASEKAVRDAINALDGNVTSSDGTNVQVKVTVADGIVSAVNITTDNTESNNNKVTSWCGTPADTNYPFEKLVEDCFDAIGSQSSTDAEVIAASLNDIDARMKAVEESVSEENLGDRTADSLDVQVLKIGGDEIAPGTATPSAVGSSASVGSSTKFAREDHTHNIAVASGDSEGQVKVAGQNATVNGWSTISGKAGSAIQGVKVNGTVLTPDSNKVVDIPAASTSAYGAVQFMTSSEAASLWANAWAAATA